ncbi:hypothetical protein [Actinacidiphila paucisporea]|nr:hypothetical protein [Actinacidiphila paucisporea]
MRQVPGFVAFYWIDAGNGVVVSTSVFQDRAGAEESNLRASNFIRDSLGAYLPHPPEITAGEVLVTA